MPGTSVTYPLEWGSTNYREKYPGSPEESVSEDNTRTVREFYVPWDLRKNAADDFLGFPSIKLAGATKYISRQTPLPHPTWPFFLYAEQVTKIEGVGPVNLRPARDGDDVPIFEEARLTGLFGPRRYLIFEDDDAQLLNGGVPDESTLLRYVEPIVVSAEKYQELPVLAALRWALDGKPMTTKTSLPLYEADVSLVWHEVPLGVVTIDKMKNFIGKTNNAAFGSPISPLGQAATGTLVCKMPDIRLIFLKNGVLGNTVTFKFRYYPNGANSFFRWNPPAPLDSGFFPVVTPTGTQQFPPADFTQLFKP